MPLAEACASSALSLGPVRVLGDAMKREVKGNSPAAGERECILDIVDVTQKKNLGFNIHGDGEVRHERMASEACRHSVYFRIPGLASPWSLAWPSIPPSIL